MRQIVTSVTEIAYFVDAIVYFVTTSSGRH